MSGTELKELIKAEHDELLMLISTGATSWDDVYEWDDIDYYNRLDSCYGNMVTSEMLHEYVQSRYFNQEI